jgi:myo-inositol-1(or 4)-monophosphatase
MSESLTAIAIEAARAGGAVVREHFRTDRLRVKEKARHDLVTSADRESESVIAEVLRRHRPQDSILAEEAGWIDGRGGECTWIVDPLDGTANFAHGLAMFSVSIACRRDDETLAGVVFDPIGDHLFVAAKDQGATWNGQPIRVSGRAGLGDAFLATGFPFRARGALDLYLRCFRTLFLEAQAIRRCGSAALDLAYTAAGIFDGFFEFRLSAWDIAAGELLIREAGGVVSDLDGGTTHLDSGNVLAGPPGVHSALREALEGLTSEAAVEALAPVSEQVPIA